MAKDSYWFKHDSSAGRGLKLRKMQHIYGHWGKGIYWDIIETLREQNGYKYLADDSSLQLLCDLIGCKDETKFLNWYKDAIKNGLLIEHENWFYSSILIENMKIWETKKLNGEKGGRGHKANQKLIKSESDSESKANAKANRKHKIIEEKSIEENKINIAFNSFRVLYPGTKNGNDTELDNFKNKHSDWESVLYKLQPSIEAQIITRSEKIKRNMFVPEWKNLKTWINGRCWEEETPNLVAKPIITTPTISSNDFFNVDK